jgi:hypothetical protein
MSIRGILLEVRAAVVVGLITACATAQSSVQVKSLIGDLYEASAVSEREKEARVLTYDAAQKHCTHVAGRFVVVDEKSLYRGLDQQTRAGLTMAGALLGSMGGNSGSQNAAQNVRGTTASDEDYRTVLQFRCEK